MTHQQFADAVGVSRGAVQQWERGLTAPTRKNQPVVAAFMGITVTELMGDTLPQSGGIIPFYTGGANQALAQSGQAKEAIKLIEIENNQEYPAIRRVALKAQAGVGGYAVEYLNNDGPPIVFRSDWYKAKGYRPDKMLALRVAGESMIPSLYEGDLIVINTEQVQPKQGLPFLVSYEGEVVVKRLVRDDGLWWLVSDNPDQRRYPRTKCNGGTEIIGEVVYRQTERI